MPSRKPPVPAVDGFVDWCCELLSPLGATRSKRMFGGHGLYIDDIFVAIVAYERLYLKVDDETRPVFLAAGCQPFEYGTKDGQRGVMSYFEVPADAMDSPDAMQPWARLAMASALRARASAPSPRPRKPRAASAATRAARPPRSRSGT